jgi:hypothetical protein
MSQDTFPFAEGDQHASLDEESSGNRKAVLVAGGVAAALVLGAGGWFFLGGSSSDSSLNNSSFVPAKPGAVAAAPQKVAVKPAKKLPTAYKAQLGRDPFKALYVVPVAAPSAAPAAPAAPTTTGTGSTGSTTTPPGTTTPTGTTRYTLKLVSISTPKPGEVRFFTWQVAGVKKTVIPAQRFGKFGEIVVLATETDSAGKVVGAVIQVGDDSPIDVKVGESVSVL